jgi:hypothetical protein
MMEAEIKIAEAIAVGQANGQLAPAHRPESVRAPDTSAPATYGEIGVSRQRVAEWRRLRDTGWRWLPPPRREPTGDGGGQGGDAASRRQSAQRG